MRNECNIIRDILPLYIDGLASEDTSSFVEGHLKKCVACRTELENMKMPNALENAIPNTQANDEKSLKAFAKKWNRKKRIVISVLTAALLVVVLLGSCFVSYLKFDTANPLSAVSGVIQITVLDKDYVEIQGYPKVILAQPNDALFIEYMENRGFIEIEEERLGGIRVFTNGDANEWIMYSQNSYFAKWTWR